ncbi:hypothetical protein QT970_26320 [Microcoleus sp. herbarium8]|uniref:hypothetical protein n=1 Tax=Microcoleus sp. herbarium8 TaxID=3055436 RepID=UPI002FD0AA3F
MDYETPDELNEFLQEVVNNPFHKHTNTEAWEREVIKKDGYYHTTEIVKKGRADFNAGFKGLTPHDLVIIYCYYYMQMHIVSSFHVFKKSESLLKDYILTPSKNIVFIDFGCGPLTSGVALAWYYGELDDKKQQDFHYIGIDNCEAMIRKAREISVRPGWIDCTFDFLKSYKSHDYILELLDIYLSSGKYQDYLIVLNYSYLFASSTLDVSNLAELVKKILNTYKTHKICLLYQNPTRKDLNTKWEQFKSFIPELSTEVVDKEEKLRYRNTTGKIKSGKSEFTEINYLYFETLVR